MTLNPYAGDPQDSEPPVYVVSGDSLRPAGSGQSQAQSAPVPAKPLFGSILLQVSLAGALLAYFLDGKEWYAAVERHFEDRARARMIEPYRTWAARFPQTYAEIAAGGSGFIGKAVLWEFSVDLSSGRASYYCEGDPMKKVEWAAVDPALREKAAEGAAVKALARVEGTRGDLPLLTVLEVPGF